MLPNAHMIHILNFLYKKNKKIIINKKNSSKSSPDHHADQVYSNKDQIPPVNIKIIIIKHKLKTKYNFIFLKR